MKPFQLTHRIAPTSSCWIFLHKWGIGFWIGRIIFQISFGPDDSPSRQFSNEEHIPKHKPNGKLRNISKNEFETNYCVASGITIEELSRLGRLAVPCECEYEECQGWQMIHAEEPYRFHNESLKKLSESMDELYKAQLSLLQRLRRRNDA